jgi:integrase
MGVSRNDISGKRGIPLPNGPGTREKLVPLTPKMVEIIKKYL